LDWLDTRLSSLEAQKGPAQKAWSSGLLDITMALALAYPISAMMVQWFWGHAIDFGGQEMIAASPPQARIFALVWLGSASICLFFLYVIAIPMVLAMAHPGYGDFHFGINLRR
jgi:hypothetical protein